MHTGRGQVVPLRLLAHHQGQARPDPAVETFGRRLCSGRVTPVRPEENSLRRRCPEATQGRYDL
jgi:hypothetical protein